MSTTSLSLAKPGLKTALAEALYNEILSNSNNYYYFLGRTLEWTGGLDTNSAPQASLEYESDTRKDIIFVKKVTSADVAFTIPRYDWVSGGVYDMYDDRVGKEIVVAEVLSGSNYIEGVFDPSVVGIGYLAIGKNIKVGSRVVSCTTSRVVFDSQTTGPVTGPVTFRALSSTGAATTDTSKFYVLTNDSNVYKCLDNNGGLPSTIKPYSTSHESIVTTDGYIWKYMYTIPTALVNKFRSLTDMPVTTATKSAYYSRGALTSVKLLAYGFNYDPGDTLVVNGDGHLQDNVFRLLGLNIDNSGSGYTSTPTVTVTDPYTSSSFVANGFLLTGQYIKTEDRIYEVVSGGRAGATAPIHTSSDAVANGASSLRYVGSSANATGAIAVSTFASANVNTTTDVITVTAHRFITGNAVVYSNGGGTSITGLTSGTTYYVIKTGANTIKLATTAANAIANTAIDLTNAGAGSAHTLTGNLLDSITLQGSIGYCAISTVGYGYNPLNPPVVTITGNGANATAVAEVTAEGYIRNIRMTNRGTGYTTASVSIDNPSAITFTVNPSTAINYTTNVFTKTSHGFTTGTRVAYTVNSGTGIAGLTVSGKYFVHVLTPDTFKLCSTYADAIRGLNFVDVANTPSPTATVHTISKDVIAAVAGAEIYYGFGFSTTPTAIVSPPVEHDQDWTKAGLCEYDNIVRSDTRFYRVTSTGIDQTFGGFAPSHLTGAENNGAPFVGTFDSASGIVVNLANNTIRLPAHTLETGSRVVYSSEGGTVIGGLTSGTTYYAIRNNVNSIQLASSYSNAKSGTAINLTSNGVANVDGDGHTITAVLAELTFIGQTAAVSSSTLKTKALVAPVIENGQIVNVMIQEPGTGYTTASIQAFGGSGAIIEPELTVGDLNTRQSNTELLAVPGTIDAIHVLNPGAGYTFANVTVVGDGVGCTATAQLQGGALTKVVVTNPGLGYTRATVTVTGDGTSQAYTHATVSPPGGHGKDAVKELYAQSISLSTTIAQDRNQGFIVNNDYRQLGIIKNLTNYNSTQRYTNFIGSACFSITGTFNYTEIDADTIFTRNGDGARFQLVAKPATAPATPAPGQPAIPYAILVTAFDNQPPEVSDVLSYSTAEQTAIQVVVNPSVDKYSGDMMFIDNRSSFQPTDEQTISIKTVIRL